MGGALKHYYSAASHAIFTSNAASSMRQVHIQPRAPWSAQTQTDKGPVLLIMAGSGCLPVRVGIRTPWKGLQAAPFLQRASNWGLGLTRKLMLFVEKATQGCTTYYAGGGFNGLAA